MNDDLISRAAVIESIRECAEAAHSNYEWDMEQGYLNAIECIEEEPSAQPEQQHGRVFNGIVVEYPSYNTYPEYKGKPYFSIKYTENGQEFIGYGTYNPEVLSEYLKEYFMPSAQPDVPDINVGDMISREELFEELNCINLPICNETVDKIYSVIENMPSAQPTLCGYDIDHLILIANVLKKENLTPERVVEALTDIERIVSMVRDEFEETLRKAVEQCKI